MTSFIFANNVNTTLAGSISSSATSITLSSSANLPTSIPSGSVLVLTLNDVATRQVYEIVYATAITGATLTVIRGQDGTSAVAWATNDFAFSPPTAGQMAAMAQLGAPNIWTASNTFNNAVTVGNPTIAGHAVNLVTAQADFAALHGSSSNVFNVAPAATLSQAMPLGQLFTSFPSSLGTNGWKQYPDSNSPTGFYIEQWGTGSFGTAPNQSVALPIAFPNAFLNATCSYGSVPPASGSCGASPGTLSTILIGNSSSILNQIWYNAKGY